MTATRDKVLDKAEAAIRMRGYHAVSFRDLADELGIKSASVHYHFRQKEDLGLALVERYSKRFFDALEVEATKALTSKDKLRAFCAVYRHILVSSDRLCLCGMLGAEAAGIPVSLNDAVAAFFEANIDWLASAFGGDDAARTKATYTVGTLQGSMMLASSMKDVALFDHVLEALLA